MQPTEKTHRFSTIFWLNTAFAVGLLVAVGVLSPVLYGLFERIVIDVLLVLFVANAIAMMGVPFKAAIQREFSLPLLGAINVTSLAVSAIIGVWLALTGRGVWSLVAYYALRDTLRGLGYAIFSPRYPILAFSRQTAKWFTDFAIGMLRSRILLTAEGRADDFLLGTLGGTGALGLYTIGWRLATAFDAVVQPAIREGIIPTFSRLKDANDESRAGLTFVLRMQLHLAVPGYVFAGLVAPELIPLVFGPQWREAVPAFRVLVLGGILFPLLSTSQQFYYAQGNPDAVFHVQKFYIAVLVIGAMLLIPPLGAVGAAVAFDGMLIMGCLLLFRAIRRDIELPFTDILAPGFVAGGGATAAGVAARQANLLAGVTSPGLTIAAYAILVGITFYALLLVLAKDAVANDITILRRALLS